MAHVFPTAPFVFIFIFFHFYLLSLFSEGTYVSPYLFAPSLITYTPCPLFLRFPLFSSLPRTDFPLFSISIRVNRPVAWNIPLQFPRTFPNTDQFWTIKIFPRDPFVFILAKTNGRELLAKFSWNTQNSHPGLPLPTFKLLHVSVCRFALSPIFPRFFSVSLSLFSFSFYSGSFYRRRWWIRRDDCHENLFADVSSFIQRTITGEGKENWNDGDSRQNDAWIFFPRFLFLWNHSKSPAYREN